MYEVLIIWLIFNIENLQTVAPPAPSLYRNASISDTTGTAPRAHARRDAPVLVDVEDERVEVVLDVVLSDHGETVSA